MAIFRSLICWARYMIGCAFLLIVLVGAISFIVLGRDLTAQIDGGLFLVGMAIGALLKAYLSWHYPAEGNNRPVAPVA